MKKQVALLAFVLVGVSAIVSAQVRPFTVRAIGYDVWSDDHTRLTGWVQLIHTSGTWKLSADQVDLFGEDRVVASGNVVFISEGGCVTADRAEFQYDPATGTFPENGTFHSAKVSSSEVCELSSPPQL